MLEPFLVACSKGGTTFLFLLIGSRSNWMTLGGAPPTGSTALPKNSSFALFRRSSMTEFRNLTLLLLLEVARGTAVSAFCWGALFGGFSESTTLALLSETSAFLACCYPKTRQHWSIWHYQAALTLRKTNVWSCEDSSSSSEVLFGMGGKGFEGG